MVLPISPDPGDSPRNRRRLFAVSLAVLVVAAGVVATFLQPTARADAGPKTFTSEADLAAFLQDGGSGYGTFASPRRVAEPVAVDRAVGSEAVADAAAGSAGSRAADYSTTNVQVAGVDEADIVKSDGRYVYALSAGEIVVVDAYPPETARVLARIVWSGEVPRNLYLDGDRLVAIGEPGVALPVHGDRVVSDVAIEPGTGGGVPHLPTTVVRVYDVSEPGEPRMQRQVRVNGTYRDSRMIGDHVYVILEAPVRWDGDRPVVPTFHPDQQGFPEIRYFDSYDVGYRYTNILSIDAHDDDAEVANEAYLLGRTAEVYVSQDNLYIVTPHRIHPKEQFSRLLDEVVLPTTPPDVDRQIQSIRRSAQSLDDKREAIQEVVRRWVGDEMRVTEAFRERLEDFHRDIARENDKSNVHRIALDGTSIDHRATGEVRGEPLDQFSMDEHRGHLRIATTSGGWRDRANHVFVLDMGMEVAGSVEGLAPGERIYSARFMGDRAYLVTFVRIDPLFAIDLSDPQDPDVLGELKIPGVSDYLHPYDEDHLIGVGRSTGPTGGGFDGVKVALFDVSDPTQPKEQAKHIVEGRGTSTEVTRDHKAFLFDRDRDLMVLPIRTVDLDGDGVSRHRGPTWQGAYAFRVDPADGFEQLGRITHADGPADLDPAKHVRRSILMDDHLYTVSPSAIQAHDLPGLDRSARVLLR